MFHKTHEHGYRAVPLEGFSWLEHSFGTKQSHSCPAPWQVVRLRQVHSDIVLSADGNPGCAGEGDGLLSDRSGYLLEIRTADCIPIFLVEERRRVIAAAHAGWRGTARGIAATTARRLCAEFAGDPRNLHAAIGPGIGFCCYEVGPEVAVHFQRHFPERKDLNQRTYLDLAEANHRQLLGAGIRENRIYLASLCTCCGSQEFHSYRREGPGAGRMANFIGIRA